MKNKKTFLLLIVFMATTLANCEDRREADRGKRVFERQDSLDIGLARILENTDGEKFRQMQTEKANGFILMSLVPLSERNIVFFEQGNCQLLRYKIVMDQATKDTPEQQIVMSADGQARVVKVLGRYSEIVSPAECRKLFRNFENQEFEEMTCENEMDFRFVFDAGAYCLLVWREKKLQTYLIESIPFEKLGSSPVKSLIDSLIGL